MKPNRTRLRMQVAVRHIRAIRLGLDDMYDIEQMLDDWFGLQDPVGNLDENDRKKISTEMARNWVHVQANKLDTERLNSALARLYADSWVLGQDLTTYEIARAVGIKKAAPSKKQLVNSLQIDWSKWRAGNRAAAALTNPPNGLKRLLDARGVKIRGMGNTTLNRIGTSLADALNQGLTRRQTAKLIEDIVNDPERALMIAGTEMSGAVVQSSLDLYRDSGVEQVQWLVADPCDECQENLDQSPIGIDEEWINGDPPVHPNCMCDIAPYVVDTGLWDYVYGDQTE